MTRPRAKFCQIIPAVLLALCAQLTVVSAQGLRTDSISVSYRIAGVLTNAKTGEPLRRATVEALNEDDGKAIASCITDNDGRFSLQHLAAAKYQLSASKRGFRTTFYDEHDEFSSAIVTGPDQDTTHLQFRVTPNAVLRGVISDDSGDLVTGARVMLFKRPAHPGPGERTAQADTTMTDDTGAYEFGNLPPGEYLLAIIATPWYAEFPSSTRANQSANSELDVAYPVTYFDSTTEERAATPIILTGGANQEANITMHAVPAVHINIPVPLRANGSPAPIDMQKMIFGNAISADAQSRLVPNSTSTTEFGGIPPGEYQLVLQGDPPRVLDLNLNSSQQVNFSGEIAINGITGRLRMTSGTPVPDGVTISLQRVDSGPGQSQYATDVRQGRFHFDAVPAGTWSIWATQASKALPVTSITASGPPIAGNIITLRDRAPELVVTVSEAETVLRGFAQKSGRGFAGAMIVLLPRNPGQWKSLTRRDQSDSDGSFTLHNVAPGEYTLIAIEDGWPLDWTSPAAMSRYLPGGTSVTVKAQSGAIQQLDAPVTIQQR